MSRRARADMAYGMLRVLLVVFVVATILLTVLRFDTHRARPNHRRFGTETAEAADAQSIGTNHGEGADRICRTEVRSGPLPPTYDHRRRGSETGIGVALVKGTVTDSGEPVPNALLTVTDASGVTSQARTDQRGEFQATTARGIGDALVDVSVGGRVRARFNVVVPLIDDLRPLEIALRQNRHKASGVVIDHRGEVVRDELVLGRFSLGPRVVPRYGRVYDVEGNREVVSRAGLTRLKDDAPVTVSAKTDQNGRFKFEGLPWEANLLCRVRGREFVIRVRDRHEKVVKLGQPVSVTARLVGVESQWVAGCDIAVNMIDRKGHPTQVGARTNERGRFSFVGVEGVIESLFVESLGLIDGPMLLTPPASELEFNVSLVTVRGQVMGHDGPTEFGITCTRTGKNIVSGPVAPGGDFEFRAVPGRYRIEAKSGMEVAREELVLSDGASPTPVTLHLGARSIVEGLVHGVFASDRERWRLELTDGAAYSIRTYTDRAGRFAFREVPPAARLFVRVDTGYESKRFAVIAGSVVCVQLYLPQPDIATGRILSHEGEPVFGALVRSVSDWVLAHSDRFDVAEVGSRVATQTDPDGRFAVPFAAHPGVRKRRLNIIIDAPGFVRKVLRAVPADVGDVRLKRGVAVGGAVVDPNGAPISGALVEIRPESECLSQLFGSVQCTDLEGRFVFSDLPKRSWCAEVRAQGFVAETVKLTPGTNPVVRCRPDVTIAGMLQGPDQEPLADYVVRVPGYGVSLTDRFGRFEIGGLSRGRYTVEVMSLTGRVLHSFEALAGNPRAIIQIPISVND